MTSNAKTGHLSKDGNQAKRKTGRPRKQQLEVTMSGNVLTVTLSEDQARIISEFADLLGTSTPEFLRSSLTRQISETTSSIQEIRKNLADYKAQLRDKYK